MSDFTNLKDQFPIENPNAVSTRLFFARENILSNVWHICDAAIWQLTPDGREALTMALHGKMIYTRIKCDTVAQIRMQVKETEQLCFRCVEEFNLAKDIIEKKKLLRFR